MNIAAIKQFLATLGNRAVHNWPSKLIAFVLAFVIWLLINVSDTSTAQRSFVLPLEVDGVLENVVPVGIPDVVEVSVSGPTSRVDRLRADLIQVVLDVGDTTGSFQRPVQVQVPQGVTLVSVTPSEVIGTLEGAISREFPVTISHTAPFGAVYSGTLETETVQVSGQVSVIDRVASVQVLVHEPGEHTVAPIAFDESGRPISQVRFDPPTIAVHTETAPALVEKTVPVTVSVASGVPAAIQSVSRDTVNVVGPAEVVNDITTLAGTVSVPAAATPGGRYTAQVIIGVPEDVFVANPVTATLVLLSTPGAPEALE